MTRFDPDLKHVTDELLDLARQRLFWAKLEVEVMVLGGDLALARRIVEHLIRTDGYLPGSAKRVVITALAEGLELVEPPGNS